MYSLVTDHEDHVDKVLMGSEILNEMVKTHNKTHDDFNQRGWYLFYEVRFDYNGEERYK